MLSAVKFSVTFAHFLYVFFLMFYIKLPKPRASADNHGSCSLHAAEIWELSVRTWCWLLLCSIESPVLINEGLLIATETGGSSEGSLRVVVHVELILDRISSHRGWLLLWRTETVSRLGERAWSRVTHGRRVQDATTHEVALGIASWAGLLSLLCKLHVKVM